MQIPSKKILVTGGCGFIGSALIRNLISKNSHQIINLDKMGYASDKENLECFFRENKKLKERYNFFRLDLLDQKSLKKLIFDQKPNLVIHLAAESHVDKSISNPNAFVLNNIVGTTNLLEVLLEFWNSLKNYKKNNFRFLHVSTDEVFGSLNEEDRFSENSAYRPNSPYSASKAASDHFVRAWYKTFNFPVITTNCSNNFGPWQFPEKLIPVILMNLIKKEKVPIYGNGKNIRDWIFVEDHVEALIKCAFNAKIGEQYCIGGDNEISNYDMAKLICSIMDKKLPWNKPYASLISFVGDRPGHDFRYSIDSSKIKKDLGWSKKYNFEDSLSYTIDWYLKNQNWILNKSREN